MDCILIRLNHFHALTLNFRKIISCSITLEPRNSTKNSPQLQADSCYIAAARTAEKTQLYCCVTQTTRKTSHLIAKHCWEVTALRLRESVFTEPLPGSRLHNLVVPLLVCLLLRNGCFCGSTVLAWVKYATLCLWGAVCR
jgi:hypothetical protein